MSSLTSSSLFCCLLAIALGIPKTVNAGSFCDNTFCSDSEYCCGYNQCCFNFGAIWYAWVLITIFVILMIVGCCCCCRKRQTPGTVIVQRPVVQPNNPGTIIVNTQQVAASNYGAAQPGYQYPQYAQQGQQKYMGAPPAYQPYQGPPGYQPPQQPYQPPDQAPQSKDPSAPYYQ